MDDCEFSSYQPAPTLAARLKAARLRAGLTQVEAAKAWGVPRDTLASWERGRQPRHGNFPRAEALLAQAEKASPAIDWPARIKSARKRAGLSLKQASERWGVPFSSLYFWDSRRRSGPMKERVKARLEPFLSEIEKGLAEPLFLDSPIRSLKMSRRAESILDAAQIKTVGDLVAISAEVLLKRRSCGPGSVRNIEAALAEEGFSLAPMMSSPTTTSKKQNRPPAWHKSNGRYTIVE